MMTTTWEMYWPIEPLAGRTPGSVPRSPLRPASAEPPFDEHAVTKRSPRNAAPNHCLAIAWPTFQCRRSESYGVAISHERALAQGLTLTGIIKCAYGESGHITYGLAGSGSRPIG